MIITSNQLGELGGASKVASPSPQETSLQVKPEVSPIVTLMGITRAFNPLSSVPQQTSFISNIEQIVANAGVNTTDICTFDAGVWRLIITASYTSNFPVVGAFAGGIVGLIIGALSVNIISLGSHAAAGGNDSVSITMDVLFDRVAKLQGVLSANGAGNSHRFETSVIASKLLP